MQAETNFLGDARRSELADFLRRRRAKLTPEMVGLPATRRRRTPGLRREEVAELADISTALYAWLEQGRSIPVSRRTVDAIAGALRLSPSERDHVYALVSHVDGAQATVPSPALERMVGSILNHPVFVLDYTWNAVIVNRAARAVFHAEETSMPPTNILAATFSESGRARFANWPVVAACLVELFRYDYARYASDADTLALVERLRAEDAAFARIWEEHGVRRTPSEVCLLNHPRAGVIAVEPSIYDVVESPGLRCMVFTPADDAALHRIGEAVCAHGDEPAVHTVRAPLHALAQRA